MVEYIPFVAGLVLTGGWGFFAPIGISSTQGIVDYFFKDEIEDFLDNVGNFWNDFWSFSWI